MSQSTPPTSLPPTPGDGRDPRGTSNGDGSANANGNGSNGNGSAGAAGMPAQRPGLTTPRAPEVGASAPPSPSGLPANKTPSTLKPIARQGGPALGAPTGPRLGQTTGQTLRPAGAPPAQGLRPAGAPPAQGLR